MKQDRIEIMENMDVKKAILKLAIPTMLGVIVQLIYNMTDTFFVGKTNDANQVAALSIVLPIFLIIQACGTIFAIGSGAYISRLLGERDYDKAKSTNATSLYGAIIIGAILTIVLLLFKNPIISAIGTSEATYQYTEDYYEIIVMFSIVLVIQVALAGFIRSEGATKESMIGMIIGNVVNIILDPIFIFTFNMGVKGAAWATIIGNAVGVICFLFFYRGNKSILAITPKYFKFTKKMLVEIFKIGFPAALIQMVMGLSFLIVNIVAVTYGDQVVAANGIFLRITSILALLTMGVAQGYQPFAGYNYGAKNYLRLLKAFKITTLYGTILALGFTIFFLLFPEHVFKIFIQDQSVVDIGVKMIRAFLWCTPFFGLQMTLTATFQSTNRAPQALFIGLGRQCILYLPLLFILNTKLGFYGFIFAQPVADILTTSLAAVMAISFIKEINSMKNDNIIEKKKYV